MIDPFFQELVARSVFTRELYAVGFLSNQSPSCSFMLISLASGHYPYLVTILPLRCLDRFL